MEKKKGKMNKIKSVDYSKWGYLFILNGARALIATDENRFQP